MDMKRRGFFQKATAAGVGLLALARGIKALAKGLPSDPDATPAKAGADVIALPRFEKNGAVPLEQALLKRKSSRDYAEQALSRDQLSRLLWAANGVNRSDGHRTTPSAIAAYPVDLLVALPEGVYRYETKAHQLVKVLGQDIRDSIPIQGSFKKAAMIALYVINKNKVPGGNLAWGDLEIGCMGQNLFLEAAALGLGACIFGLVRYDKVSELLKLRKDQILRVAQAAGPLKD